MRAKPISPRVKLVPLFLELFCGSGTQISAKCVMAFRICHKSTCFVDLKKNRRRDRTQEATQLRLVPKKKEKTEFSEKLIQNVLSQQGVRTRIVPFVFFIFNSCHSKKRAQMRHRGS